MMTESFVAWGDQSVARADDARVDDVDDGSELAGDADQIMAGGTMSILRRKGK